MRTPIYFHRATSGIGNVARNVIVLLGVLSLCACDNRGPSIESVRAAGELRVALVSVPHTYYLAPDGILGFDYDLLRKFCATLGVRLALTMVETRAQAQNLVRQRKVHLGAGLIAVRAHERPELRYGPSYSMIQAQVIYLSGNARPRNINDLVGATIETPAGGIGESELLRLAPTTGTVRWTTPADSSVERMLARVNAGVVDYAIVPSTDFTVLRLKYPRLDIGFDLGQLHATAWVLSGRSQVSIDRAIADFFSQNEKDGLRRALWDRYYGHYGQFDFVDARAFLRAYRERFPRLDHYFRDAARNVGIDWRLLAALSYQESHWDPDARSPTGVRGLMMLTEQTARHLDVSRLDPSQAVAGGARYLADLRKRLPAAIGPDERVWFALAAYNIGLGHLEDARVLTEGRGANPNVWRDVRRYLPLLSNQAIAATSRYGAARGGETVHFVTNIRRYFDAIRQLERRPVSSGDAHGGPEIRILRVL